MPKYQRKTDGPSRICLSKLEKARKALIEKGRPIRKVAETYGISISSLKNYKKKWLQEDGNGVRLKRLHGTRVLTEQEEKAFVQVLQDFRLLKIPVTANDALFLCYSFAEKVGSENITKWRDTKKATLDWMAGFMRRNPKAKDLIRNNYKGGKDPNASPSSLTAKNSKEIDSNLGTLAAGNESNHSDSDGNSKDSGSPDYSKGSASDSSSTGFNSSDSNNGSRSRKTFLVSAKTDKPFSFSGSFKATTLRKSSRITKAFPPTLKKTQGSESTRILKDLEIEDSTSVPPVEQEQPSSSTAHPSNEQNSNLQNFEEALDEFVKNLVSMGIQPSDHDIKLIRQESLRRLNLIDQKTQDKPSRKQKQKSSVPKQDVFQSTKVLFANLYAENLRNNVREGLMLEYDEDFGGNVLKATENFEEYMFVTEIKGTILDFPEGKQRSLARDYVDGKNRGKLFFLGVLEQKKWMDCSSDQFLQAIQDSNEPNLVLKFKKVPVGSEITKRLFFAAGKPIKNGEILSYDFGKVYLRNEMDYPFQNIHGSEI